MIACFAWDSCWSPSFLMWPIWCMRSSWSDVSLIRLCNADVVSLVTMCTLYCKQWNHPKSLLICSTTNQACFLPHPTTHLILRALLPFWKAHHPLSLCPLWFQGAQSCFLLSQAIQLSRVAYHCFLEGQPPWIQWWLTHLPLLKCQEHLHNATLGSPWCECLHQKTGS